MTIRHPAIMKGLYWATGSIMAAQLIYCYDSELGWLHVAFFLTNLILTDLFIFDQRKPVLEAAVLFSYAVVSAILMFHVNMTLWMYAVLLFPAALYNIWLSVKGLLVFSDETKWHYVSARNRALVEKNGKFMSAFFILVALLSVGGIISGLIQFIK